MAAIAAADVAKSANMGVIIWVKLIASNGRESLEITIVLPGIIVLLEEKKDLLTNSDLPSGSITKILSLSAAKDEGLGQTYQFIWLQLYLPNNG